MPWNSTWRRAFSRAKIVFVSDPKSAATCRACSRFKKFWRIQKMTIRIDDGTVFRVFCFMAPWSMLLWWPMVAKVLHHCVPRIWRCGSGKPRRHELCELAAWVQGSAHGGWWHLELYSTESSTCGKAPMDTNGKPDPLSNYWNSWTYLRGSWAKKQTGHIPNRNSKFGIF